MSCPICARQSDAKYRPFCSRRCADIDLGRWLNGTYVLPGTPEDQAENIPDLPESPTH
jgi:endogenous inhibitor of DNA gyrase (YacG/DUF329 family)